MRISKQQALEELVDLAYQHQEIDTMSLVELWRDKLYEHEQAEEKRIKALQREPIYGIQHMELVTDKSDGGSYTQKLVPMQRFRVQEKDIPSFARQYKIDLAGLWEVLQGNALEVGEWRSFEGGGLSSRVYVDRSAKQALLRELAEEDRKEAARKAQRDELDKQVVAVCQWHYIPTTNRQKRKRNKHATTGHKQPTFTRVRSLRAVPSSRSTSTRTGNRHGQSSAASQGLPDIF